MEERERSASPLSDSPSPSATVFMSYPFNDKNYLSISLGQVSGLNKGDLVIYEQTFLGEITAVFERYSVFKTIFNTDWEFPVYIGANQARGLFQGGIEPRVVLISKKEKINVGDLIVLADPVAVASGLVIGTVSRVNSTDSSPFFEVSVSVPYSLNDIRQVSIITK